MTFNLPFGRPGQPPSPAAAQQRSKYLTDAMSSLQDSSQNIRSPGELGSRLLAQALLQWGRTRADEVAAGTPGPGGQFGAAPSTSSSAQPMQTPSEPAGFDFNAQSGRRLSRSVGGLR
ncbi:MAG: hypothetical protein JWM33_2133 [Caulobacteraceae bacterium]|nr:hypothetical protein [Caulobacteraceae bacterium]